MKIWLKTWLMNLRASPLAVMCMLALTGFNAWLLISVFVDLASPLSALPIPVLNQVKKSVTSTPDIGLFSPKSASTYSKTLAQPVFFKTRAPYVAPPPAPVTQIPPPQIVIADPNLSVTGVIINNTLKKAYLLKPSEHLGTWVAEGENVQGGWTLQTVKPTGITLKHNNRTIEFELYRKQ